ncbi:MAG: SLC13 family permease [Propionibacteriaceae bacterium]|nr:SLC13 family permease [Propionibacteriaceae bacterium]
MIPLDAAGLINSTQTQAIIALVIIALAFFIGSITDLHMGVLVLSVLAIVGPVMYHDKIAVLQEGWNTNLMFTLIGVTYLFALANNNGTVNWIVAMGMKAVAGKAQLFPFAMFAIVAVLTAIGCATPAACAIMMPIALAFARQHGVNPIPMAQAVIQGCSAGSFSPMGIYGIIIKGSIDKNIGALNATGNAFNHMLMWSIAIIIDLLIVVVCFLLYRGNPGPSKAEVEAAGRDAKVDLDASADALNDEEFGDQSGEKAIDTEIKLNGERIATLAGILLMAAVTITAAVVKFDVATTDADGAVTMVTTKLTSYVDISWTSLAIAAVLSLAFPKAAKGAIMQVAWPTILLVCGIVTYISMLENHGVVQWIGGLAANAGSPVITSIIIFFIAALVSAYASTTGLFPILVPIALPFLGVVPEGVQRPASLVSATMLMAGLGISASTVDCSPFSTNGALGVANAAHQSEYTYKGLFKWSWILIVGTPIVCWALLMLPPWGRLAAIS